MRPATASVVANAVTQRFVTFGTRTSSVKPAHTRRPLFLNRRMTTTPAAAATDAVAAAPAPIVQYVVLRRDLGEGRLVLPLPCVCPVTFSSSLLFIFLCPLFAIPLILIPNEVYMCASSRERYASVPLTSGQGMGWPLGSICAQAAHAAVAAVWMYKDHADTVREAMG